MKQFVEEYEQSLATNGYAVKKILSERDLAEVRQLILNQISPVIGRPITWSELSTLPTEKMTPIVQNKSLRIFSDDAAKKFISLQSIEELQQTLKGFVINGAVDPILGLTDRYEIYFRIVAPGQGGSPSLGHIDWWYDELYDIDINDRPTLKIWLSIDTDPGKNGLLVLPKCKNKGFEYERIDTEYGPRPRLISPIPVAEYDFPIVNSGDGIIFQSNTVMHLGAQNQSNRPRVSIEISMRNTIFQYDAAYTKI
jgi:hypothetical protein